MDYGFAAVVAPSFGDIFRNNASKQGLVIVELPSDDVEELMALVRQDPTADVLIDVDRMTIEATLTGWRRTFVLDPITRERLLNGWDDIGLSLLQESSIASYEREHQLTPLGKVFGRDGRVLHSGN
jgi:3-isopropylmalate/(R)-2-methylmalate dehydratase small subunit